MYVRRSELTYGMCENCVKLRLQNIFCNQHRLMSQHDRYLNLMNRRGQGQQERFINPHDRWCESRGQGNAMMAVLDS
jgi:hypothetical protein